MESKGILDQYSVGVGVSFMVSHEKLPMRFIAKPD